MKKRLALVLSVVFMLSMCFTLTGCGGSQPAADDSSADTAKEVTLESYCAEHPDFNEQVMASISSEGSDVSASDSKVEGNKMIQTITYKEMEFNDDDIKEATEYFNVMVETDFKGPMNDLFDGIAEETGIDAHDLSYVINVYDKAGKEVYKTEITYFDDYEK